MDSTLAESNPTTCAATASPTTPGKAPGDRIPITGLLGRTLTSATGAKSMFTPPAASQRPVRSAVCCAARCPVSRSPATAAPSTMAPGNVTGIRILRTSVPFSWSAPMSSGGSPRARACTCAAFTTRAHCAAVPGAMMIRPPGRVWRTRARAAAGSRDPTGGISICRTRSCADRSAYTDSTTDEVRTASSGGVDGTAACGAGLAEHAALNDTAAARTSDLRTNSTLGLAQWSWCTAHPTPSPPSYGHPDRPGGNHP